jgi:predicted MFS family arabinose efflux permease
MRQFSSIRTLRRLFSYRDYRRFAIGNSISVIGTWMQRVTVGWLTWELTGSGTWLGLMAFADLFPTLLVGIVAGAAADRWPLMPLLRISQFLGFLQASAMALLYVLGLLDAVLLFAFTIAMGTVAAFAQPARMTVVFAMVPRADFGPAVATNSLSFNLARFVGPALSGLLIATAGMTWAFIANALSYLVFVWALFRIDPAFPERRRRGTGMLADIVEGFIYAVRRPGIWVILAITISMGLGSRPVIELLPGFAAAVFGSDASGLAALTSAVGIGAVVGGTWMVGRAGSANLTRGYLTTALIAGCVVVAFALAPSIHIAAPLAALLGFVAIATGIAGQTLMQLSAEEHVRGRMMSLFALLQRGVPAMAALALGALSEVIGFRIAAICTALVLIGVAATLLAVSGRFAGLLDNGGKEG